MYSDVAVVAVALGVFFDHDQATSHTKFDEKSSNEWYFENQA